MGNRSPGSAGSYELSVGAGPVRERDLPRST